MQRQSGSATLTLSPTGHSGNEGFSEPTPVSLLIMPAAIRKDRPARVPTQLETGKELWVTVVCRANVAVIPSAVPQRPTAKRMPAAKNEESALDAGGTNAWSKAWAEGLSAFHMNACSLSNKWRQLRAEAVGTDSIVIVETWLHKAITRACNSPDTVHTGLTGEKCDVKHMSTPNTQACSCNIQSPNCKVTVVGIYKKPLLDEEEGGQLFEYLTRVNNHMERIVIMEDFNSPEHMAPFVLETKEVEATLKLLDQNRAAGPDGLHPAILQPIADIIAGANAAVRLNHGKIGANPQGWAKGDGIEVSSSKPAFGSPENIRASP
ncbi:unnamed protein product [Echinostoma caproni]|uniref:Endo/exonuclease/phosphatase domain-containing protein n=1 Tax=Echinostoma caproni TaxID=27848 RepID=A0A183AYH6_9TREM|nr:unnamed protein product [Echinostoma caproni]